MVPNGRKSRDTVPLNSMYCTVCYGMMWGHAARDKNRGILYSDDGGEGGGGRGVFGRGTAL